jgi:phosphocarrier protein HPr
VGLATGGRMRLRLKIVNDKGLHARASAKFVETVERFDAEAEVSRDGMTVSGDSIMGLMMLVAAYGTHIDVGPSGREAEDLAEALRSSSRTASARSSSRERRP